MHPPQGVGGGCASGLSLSLLLDSLLLLRCAAGNSTVQLGTVGNAGERSGTPGARGTRLKL